MVLYFFKKLTWYLPAYLLITLLSFWLNEITPSDPVLDALQVQEGQRFSASSYSATAKQLRRDKPLFYFELTNQAFPDTLYKFVHKHKIQSLSARIWKFGNWDKIVSYYQRLEQLSTQLPDSSAVGRLLEKLLYERSAKQEASSLDQAQTIASVEWQAEMRDLRELYRQLETEKQSNKCYYPKIIWYGLDNQYHYWMESLFNGKFAGHRQQKGFVATIRIPIMVTFCVSSMAILTAFSLGIVNGYCLMRWEGKILGYAYSNLLFMLYAVPTFLMATFCVSGINGLVGLDRESQMSDNFITFLFKNFIYLIFPMLCVGYRTMTVVSRHLYSALMDEARKDYIRTARAKGLLENQILIRHQLKNALFPLITLFGQLFPLAVAGSVTVEAIFDLPGMGQLAALAISTKNYMLLYAILSLSAFFALLGSLMADVLYAYVYPPQRGKFVNS
jgi:peptide/nickel transport system permease protein